MSRDGSNGSRTIVLWALLAAGLVFGSASPAPASAAGATTARPAWHRCTDAEQKGFQCAALRVPLDYGRPRGRHIRLALIRHRATDRRHRLGSLFWEPGGPGGSGVRFLPPVERAGAFPKAVVARFDIVSWDPRGVGASTPVRCFADPAAEVRFFAGSPLRSRDGFPVGRDQRSTWIERYRRFGARCERRAGRRLLRHVSTVDTVRDLDLMRRLVGDRMINYIGTSYGTEVGAVYANMFPRRIRAMVLDGDINPRAWSHPLRAQNGGRFLPGGLRFRADVETVKTLRAYLDRCGRTDTAHCAFSAGSPKATRAKFTELLARMPVDGPPGQTSYAQAVSRTIIDLYSLAAWKGRAETLQRLWTDGPSAVAPPAPAGDEEQELAIVCGEVPSPRAKAFAGIDAFARQRSGVVGPYWAFDYEPCSTWPVRAAHRYGGPFDRRTANPVLVIGNTFDPATPLRSAVAMTKQLARSRLLTVKGYGHTALLNPSACASRYVSRYYIHGTLPPKGTRCAQDQKPFGD